MPGPCRSPGLPRSTAVTSTSESEPKPAATGGGSGSRYRGMLSDRRAGGDEGSTRKGPQPEGCSTQACGADHPRASADFSRRLTPSGPSYSQSHPLIRRVLGAKVEWAGRVQEEHPQEHRASPGGWNAHSRSYSPWRALRGPTFTRGSVMSALRSLCGGAVKGVLAVGLRSIATVETVLVAALFHDEFGRTEDS
jgi:hypothetical protein